MNRAASLEVPKAEMSPARLGNWDYFFRALSLASILLFVALGWDLLAHPDAPTFGTQSPPVSYRALFGFVLLPLWWLISVRILWRAPGNLVGRFLLLLMIGELGWQFTFGIGSPTFASLSFELFYFYWGALGIPSFAYLLMVFPDGRLYPSRWRTWVMLFAATKVVGTFLELMSIQPGAATFRPMLAFNPFFLPPLAPFQFALTATIGSTGALIVAGMLMGIGSLALRYRGSSLQVRRQIKWLLLWAVVAVFLMSLYSLIALGIPSGNPEIAVLVPLVLYVIISGLLIAAIGVAILRHRLFDIDLILNRTLVFGVLTAFVILAYGLMVGYLSTVFHSDNLVFSLIATGLVAVLFQPLREWLQREVNRLMYGERDDPSTVLLGLGRQLKTAIAPNAVLATIVETLTSALKVPYAAIALKDGDEFRMVAAHGQPVSAPLTFPLQYQGELVGQLRVAPRAAHEALATSDLRLIEQIAHQTGVVAHSVRLSDDLQRARERLISAREEERRRLRRDLHDGLGPQLASQTLTLDALSKLLTADPAAAADLLQALKAQSKDAIADIRRLVYALRPPALDDLGLVGALREQLAQYQQTGIHFTLSAPDPLPSLPAAVEVAAFRIAQEALTNVARHSHAASCHVALAVDGAFQLTVVDDGCGLPSDHRLGVGLHSMRERSEELGGTCVIEASAGGGICVMARLPLGN